VNPLEEYGLFHVGWLTYPVTIIYLIAYINIFNLIDGLDGLASGIAFIASMTLFVLSLLRNQVDAASLAIALAGSTLGFLKYNFHPASIFLGDCGSLLLGFTLATVSLLSVTR
ncbi:MAG: MraY family glycosyltransferase, partial [Coriobacteriaceae bacterium]|nr:MraY family glycosyltransferase [Coriobacteriaceae bacterium]